MGWKVIGQAKPALLRLSWDNGDRTILVNPELGGITLGWNLVNTAQDELFAAIEGNRLSYPHHPGAPGRVRSAGGAGDQCGRSAAE